MKSGPKPVSAVTTVVTAWGSGKLHRVPRWVLALAVACDRDGRANVAERLTYSQSALRQVFNNNYVGNIATFEAASSALYPPIAATATETAQSAWDMGDGVPDWIVALAEACDRDGRATVCRRFVLSASVLSQVLGRTYKGDLDRIEQMARGAWFGVSVDCPMAGNIGRDRCLVIQREYANPEASEWRQQHYRKYCRGGCQNYRAGSASPTRAGSASSTRRGR